MEYQDYYQTLGVPRTASTAEIKKAFRRLAREHHPDAKPGDKAAEQRFKAINEAHAVLSDPEKRKKYDTLGSNWEAYSRAGEAHPGGNPFAGFGGRAGQSGNVRYEFRTSGGGDFSDFFRTFFMSDEGGAPAGGRTRTTAQGLSFEDILGQMGVDDASTGRSAGGRPRAREQTAEAIAEIGLEEAFSGTTRLVDVGGRRLEVKLPRGADNGTRVRLTGQGPEGGDLVVVVKVRPHPVFTRRGADLERELPVTLEEALLGAEVPVTTLKGRVVLTLPAGTQNGRTFRLKGQGMPHLRGDGLGDLLARIRVVLPTGLDDKTANAARKFLDSVNQPDPR
jgi:curved DNA-binding protein